MIKFRLNSGLLLSTLFLAACATRQPILTTPAVSMTTANIPTDYKGKEIGPVNSRYCYGDEALTRKGDNVGLMDEVIFRAQQDSKATYITNATFFTEGKCIVLEGTAVK